MCFLEKEREVQEQEQEKQEEACPWMLSVDEMGIQATPARGCLADEAWLASFVVPNYHSFFHHLVYIDLPHKKLTYLRTVSQGQFGYIDLARYDTVGHSYEVYVKRPIRTAEAGAGREVDRTVYEPYLQQLVREGLTRYGLPHHVPRILEVFRLHSGVVCFAMEEVEGAVTMDVYLSQSGLDVEVVSERIQEILWHVAILVWIMNDGLGVNHRDLKPSNFLLRRRAEPIRYTVTVPPFSPSQGRRGKEEQQEEDEEEKEQKQEEKTITWETTLHLSLIDFGFACAGSFDTRQAHVSLSAVYSRSDPCPKDGRDMFLFLGYLYSDYHRQMTEPLRRQFESWLAIPGSDLCGFLRKDSDVSKRWLYYLSGSENVFQLRCNPALVLEGLKEVRGGGRKHAE